MGSKWPILSSNLDYIWVFLILIIFFSVEGERDKKGHLLWRPREAWSCQGSARTISPSNWSTEEGGRLGGRRWTWKTIYHQRGKTLLASICWPEGPSFQWATWLVRELYKTLIITSARFWGAEDMRTCPAKGDGKLVMTSDIVSPLGLVRSLVIVCFSNSCDASEQHKWYNELKGTIVL